MQFILFGMRTVGREARVAFLVLTTNCRTTIVEIQIRFSHKFLFFYRSTTDDNIVIISIST